MQRKIIIGSRGSELALWQANFIFNELKSAGVASEIKIIKTQGDKIQNLSFDKIEGKGFFTKELEDALLNKEIDLAVHSHKDLPTENPEGLVVAAVSYREDPSDILIIRKEAVNERSRLFLKQSAVVGTSSGRRKSQLLSFRSDLQIKDLRGNVPTRIQKLRDGDYDAIVLATAGIERLSLNLEDLFLHKLDIREFIAAPAQGVLALQTRRNDEELINALQKINHPEVQERIAVERKVLNLFEGGCQLPLGVYCEKDEEDETLFKVWAALAKDAGSVPKYLYIESKREDIAEVVVDKLKNMSSHSVFITRNLRNDDILSRVLGSNGYRVEGRSLIEMRPIAIKEVPKSEWIFFSSKHAVKFFFEQKPKIDPGIKFGTVGKATADAVRKYGHKPEFIGYSTNTKLTGKQFAAQAKSSKVLFPIARGSMKTIQLQLNPAQVANLVVYETIKYNDVEVPDSDIIVFTSPSNVEAFFEKNRLRPDQKIVAMGGATGAALKDAGVLRYKLPASFDDISISQVIFSF